VPIRPLERARILVADMAACVVIAEEEGD
jgi:hypothetical protein